MKTTQVQRKRRQKEIRSKVSASGLPRLTIFRSSKHIYASLIEPDKGSTVFTVSDKTQKSKKTKTEKAHEVGKAFALKAREKKIKKIVFDRAGYLYHGRVRAVAEGAREGGLDF